MKLQQVPGNTRKVVCYPSSRQLKKQKLFFCPVLCRAVFMPPSTAAFHNTPVELKYKDSSEPSYLCNNPYTFRLLL